MNSPKQHLSIRQLQAHRAYVKEESWEKSYLTQHLWNKPLHQLLSWAAHLALDLALDQFLVLYSPSAGLVQEALKRHIYHILLP